ncbi:hypothetical protein IWW39_000247 [Coemansia spiralis]|uniref:Uncharacterized protein n=1 Tax=Coemansia spiralis TaxID=417178 RepID=A0A9W8L7B8_9FUNG|nr:hypothetical protein IWW39_000247 [Coemansia spiralis]
MPLLHTRSFAINRHEAQSEWSCVSCTAQSNCYEGDTWRSLRPRKDFTESQVMGLALVLAEQYVRESQEEECDGFSLVGWSHVEHSPDMPRERADMESRWRQEYLSLPMRSTRSRDVRMQQRLASTGSTVCELEPASVGEKTRSGGRQRSLFRRPVKWIKGIVGSLS